jgi:hypothetical protein
MTFRSDANGDKFTIHAALIDEVDAQQHLLVIGWWSSLSLQDRAAMASFLP